MRHNDIGGFWRAGAMALAFLAACGGKGESGGDVASWSPAGLRAVEGVPAPAIRQAIEKRLGGSRPAKVDEDQWRHVKLLYAAFGQGPLWFDEDGFDDERMRAFANALVEGNTDGLQLDRYPLEELDQAVRALEDNDAPDPDRIARADVLITGAFAALGEDLLTGQVDPRKVSQAWHIDPQEEKVDSALVRTLRAGTLERSIAQMRPQDEDYQVLRRELTRFRGLAARGDWPRVPAGRALKPGDRDAPARLAALRNRLRAEGLLGAMDTTPAGAGDTARGGRGSRAGGGAYDRELAGAVARFQAAHTIPVDSILGAETVQSMNRPVSYRMGQIAANLERYRWLPRSLGDRYVLVNVPAFRLAAFEGGKKALEMKVIVGAEYEDRATPVFSDSMQYVVFRPYWLVPDSIAAKEIFPKAETDPAYLERNQYELYQSEGKRRVRQRPGPKNSLGLVKFLFPNDFAIYLHDTPDDRLFEQDVRAFSHGCIRLEKPDALAQWVLGWDADRVRQSMQQGRDDRSVTLPRKLPVYIVYFTAFSQNGQLRFGNDLYARDDELVDALAGGQSSPEAVAAAQRLLDAVDG